MSRIREILLGETKSRHGASVNAGMATPILSAVVKVVPPKKLKVAVAVVKKVAVKSVGGEV